MIESIIEGYAHNQVRDPNFRLEVRNCSQVIGEVVYLSFQPLVDLKSSVGPAMKEALREYFAPLAWVYTEIRNIVGRQ
jgi:hypothetical protein